MKTLQTQCDLEQTNSFFQVFYSYFVDQSCEPFIQSSDYREALSFCTTRSVFGLHHRRIFRNRFRSISEEEWTAAQTFLLSHTLLKLKVLHNTTSLIKYPNINPAYDQMFKPKKTQLLQSWSIHDHPSSEQTVEGVSAPPAAGKLHIFFDRSGKLLYITSGAMYQYGFPLALLATPTQTAPIYISIIGFTAPGGAKRHQGRSKEPHLFLFTSVSFHVSWHPVRYLLCLNFILFVLSYRSRVQSLLENFLLQALKNCF